MNLYDHILNSTALQSVQNQGESTIWIPVIASIITAVFALGGILYSTRYVKNNIKMNARIEWIQKVRETAAEVISLCYSLIQEIDEKEAPIILLKAQEKINLLILYFGPDTLDKGQLKKIKNFFLTKNANEGKNDNIVEFLKKILTDIEKYYNQIDSDKLKMLKIEMRILKDTYPLEKTGERLLDAENNYIYVKDYPKLYYKEKEGLEAEIKNYLNPKEVKEDMEKLRETLRNYLKIEWNFAKKGK